MHVSSRYASLQEQDVDCYWHRNRQKDIIQPDGCGGATAVMISKTCPYIILSEFLCRQHEEDAVKLISNERSYYRPNYLSDKSSSQTSNTETQKKVESSYRKPRPDGVSHRLISDII